MTRDEAVVQLTAEPMTLGRRMDVELGELERVAHPSACLLASECGRDDVVPPLAGAPVIPASREGGETVSRRFPIVAADRHRHAYM